MAVLESRDPSINNLTIYEIATEYVPPGWTSVFKFAEPELKLISRLLKNKDYYPEKRNLFKAFDLCPLASIRVVILGQDPYPGTCDDGTPNAMGLAFSVDQKCQPIPASLRNIFKELSNEYSDYKIPTHGDLTKWAEQGVLLLNTKLTVKPGQPNHEEHKGIWKGFLNKVLKSIIETNPECIFLLWGKSAHDLSSDLGQRSIKLYASHPSPQSAYTSSREIPSFIGCNHFVKTNEFLQKTGKPMINWQT